MKYLLNGSETDRLNFRLLTPNDHPDWLPLFSSGKARYLSMDQTKSADELCQAWMDKVFYRYENDLGGMNVLEDKTSGRMVGQCGLLIQQVDGEEVLEIGYSLLPEFWGRGYATEAAQKCRDEAFHRGFADHLISLVDIANLPSEKVARRNGMVLEKFLPDYRGHAVNVFGINRQQWDLVKKSGQKA